MSATREERGKSIAEKRKKQILDAALEIYSRKGAVEASTSEIAEAAGVSHGTVFYYFPKKRDILLGLVNRYISIEPGMTLFAGIDMNDVPNILPALINNRLNMCFDKNRELVLIMSEIQRDPELRHIYSENIIKPVLEINQKFYKSGVAGGNFREIDSEIVVRIIMALFIGFTLVYRVEGKNGFLTRGNRKELTAKITDILMNGIGIKSERHTK